MANNGGLSASGNQANKKLQWNYTMKKIAFPLGLFLLVAVLADGPWRGCPMAAAAAEGAEQKEKESLLKSLPILSDEQKKAVEQALKDLNSSDFEIRDRAIKKIQDTGPGALPLLDAAVKTKDNEDNLEVRQNIRKLMAEIERVLEAGPIVEDRQAALHVRRKVFESGEYVMFDLELKNRGQAELSFRSIEVFCTNVEGMFEDKGIRRNDYY